MSTSPISTAPLNGNGGGVGEEIQMERPLLKAPVEMLNKAFRNSQKLLEKEMNTLVSSINDMNKKKNTITKDEVTNTIDKLLLKMNNLKRRMDETKTDEENNLRRMKARVEHLKVAANTQHNIHQREKFNNVRVDRITIDYLLREGYYDTAILLASSGKITDLCDIESFVNSKKVIDGLIKHDCNEALQWCNDNKSKLKKLNSSLEFNIRIQEFIELVRNNKLGGAISYARQHLSPNASTNMKEIQRAMAVLAFNKDTKCERYRELFDEARWTALIDQFKSDSYNLYCLTTKSLLNITFQSGLSSLKTESCKCESSQNINCPVCDPGFQTLAGPLPVALQSHSCLICRISGEVMNEDNPPYVLPNGQLYCRNAMVEMAQSNNNIITDPQSGAQFEFNQVRRAFIS